MLQPKIIASGVAENTGKIYETLMTINRHTIIADEPETVGGKDKGPAPGDYLCMSLASCKAITMRMYAQRKNWKAELIKVKVDLVKGTNTEAGNNTFYCEIDITGDLTNEQRSRMMEIAKACPLDKMLRKPNDIVSVLANDNNDKKRQ